ncbi:MAG: hypothetical protein VB144_11520 [Clostridia bacterium]|nr:hypothetical protein [Clostridia bacterium]
MSSIATMDQECTYWPPGEGGEWGGGGFGVPQTLKCRYQGTTKLVRSKDGRELVASAVYWLLQPIDLQGRIAPGRHAGEPVSSAKEPLSLLERVGLNGETDHWQVYI